MKTKNDAATVILILLFFLMLAAKKRKEARTPRPAPIHESGQDWRDKLQADLDRAERLRNQRNP